MICRCIALLLLCLLPALASAKTIELRAPQLALDGTTQYLEDIDHHLDISTVRAPGVQWHSTDNSAFNRGYSASTWWLKLTLHNPDTMELLRLLEIGYAALDHVAVYVVANDQVQQQFIMGDKLPFAERPIEHRFYVVPIHWQPGQTLDIYVQARSQGTIQIPLTLWSHDRFNEVDGTRSVMQGIYFGGMIAIACYNLLIYLVLRDRNYLYYVCFMLSVLMTLAAQSGQAFRYLWPQATHWNDLSIIVSTAAAALFSAWFTDRFLRVDTISKWLSRLLRMAALVGAVAMLLCFVLPYRLMSMVVASAIVLSCMVALSAGTVALIRRVPSARIYMLAWTALLFGAVVLVLSRFGVLPANAVTEYAPQFGSLLECILLSLALAQRINAERRLRFAAQAELLESTRLANVELEARVHERTAELETLNARLQELSDIDQLTGLKNRRVLDHVLLQEWTRACRHQQSLAVVLIDIDFFKHINDDYGHLAGDAVLQQMAQRLASGLRWPGDLVARYGGEEFCLVLSQTNDEGAATVAERVRVAAAAHPFMTAGVAIDATISCGIFAGVPSEDLTVTEFLRRADVALYQSKQDGRNRVTIGN